mmetsp:Transcript_15774/g.16372  ORF Transcript_15774/g.16372 Transcript_15774/m.16372 type:complete len:80 (-) Transcript_15774:74-313(-)
MEGENVSLVSKKFWISFFDYYSKFLKRVYQHSVKYGGSFIFHYGFDTLLFIATISCLREVYDLKKNIGMLTVKGGEMLD